jgi:hypothetical protein
MTISWRESSKLSESTDMTSLKNARKKINGADHTCRHLFKNSVLTRNNRCKRVIIIITFSGGPLCRIIFALFCVLGGRDEIFVTCISDQVVLVSGWCSWIIFRVLKADSIRTYYEGDRLIINWLGVSVVHEVCLRETRFLLTEFNLKLVWESEILLPPQFLLRWNWKSR